MKLGSATGWLITPLTSPEAANQLVRDCIALEKAEPNQEKYHGIFMSHTAADKPFVRRLRKDLLEHGVPRVWADEGEIEIGDSLIEKIDEGMKQTRYIGVVLSSKSIKAPWVKKELDIAMNREVAAGEVVVLSFSTRGVIFPRSWRASYMPTSRTLLRMRKCSGSCCADFASGS